jgi:hypothetical protein
MGLSARSLLLLDDVPHRLAGADYTRLHAGRGYIPALAGQRIRWASLVIELFDRQAVNVVHRNFSFMQFDQQGRLDVQRLNQDQVARMDAFIAAAMPNDRSGGVVDATQRFAVRGGQWRPSAELRTRLDAAALGLAPCPRVKVATLQR